MEKDDEQVNGKSIMGLMMLAAGHGSKVKVTAEGADAEAAIAGLEALITGGFGSSREFSSGHQRISGSNIVHAGSVWRGTAVS